MMARSQARSLSRSMVRRAIGFNIASTNPSAYYDRTALATLFQDSAGTIAIPDSGYSIGYGGDLSGGGNNQIQATAGKLPILMQSPAGGVRNLLTYTEDFGNAAWAKIAAATCPNASTINTPAINDYVFEVLSASTYEGKQVTLQVELSGAGTFSIGTYDNVSGFQLDVVALTGGFIKYTATKTVGAGAVDVRVVVGRVGSATATTAQARNAQLELGSTATPYQKVTNQYTVTEEGVPSVWSANFDADDELITTFPASLGAGCTVCRSLPSTGASITTGVTLTATYTDNVDAHALLIYTAAQWAALDAGQIANITKLLNQKAGL